MSRPDGSLRLLVAAFGDPGHAFPAIGLARELGRRGHEVLVETWERWREAVVGEGLAFTGAQEYTVYPPPGPDTPDGQTAAAAAAGGGGGRGAARDTDPARLSGAAAGNAAVLARTSTAADRVWPSCVAG